MERDRALEVLLRTVIEALSAVVVVIAFLWLFGPWLGVQSNPSGNIGFWALIFVIYVVGMGSVRILKGEE